MAVMLAYLLQTISECISVLHIVCTVNEEMLHSVIQVIKQLLHRALKDNSKRRALLSVLDFLLTHGKLQAHYDNW